eukprot:scaffold246708_cov28-Tisochrysis_lutea.AAC.1
MQACRHLVEVGQSKNIQLHKSAPTPTASSQKRTRTSDRCTAMRAAQQACVTLRAHRHRG